MEYNTVLKIKPKNTANANIQRLCGICGKTFHRKGYFEKHLLVCETIQKSKHVQEADALETADVPSQKQLYTLLLELTAKYTSLEHEVKRLRNYVDRTKKKINILEWLKENCRESISYSEWLSDINITDAHLEHLFKFGYVDGFFLILQQHLPLTNIVTHPIKCFDQKHNQFFKYDNDVWITMDQIEITNMIRNVNCKIMKKFMEWKERHNTLIQEDDKFHEKYVDYMRIVLGGNRTKEQSYKMILNKLYAYLKCDLQNIIQYEFIF